MDERFKFSERPVGVKELTRRLNRIRAENASPVTYAMVNRWLLEIGALELVQVKEGRTAKKTTEKGETLGLSTRWHHTKNGCFKVVVFDRNAQVLVAEHFEELLFPNTVSDAVPQNRKTTMEDMVNAMKRTEFAIQAEMQKRRPKE